MESRMVRRIAALALLALGVSAVFLVAEVTDEASSKNLLPSITPTVPRSLSTGTTPSAPATNGETSQRPSSSPSRHQDRTLPTPVSQLALLSNSASHYVIAWQASQDAAGIRHYLVMVDGYLTAKVQGTVISLAWPASTEPILIQVAAVDNNGKQGEWRAIVVIPPPVGIYPADTGAPRPTTAQSMPVPVPESTGPRGGGSRPSSSTTMTSETTPATEGSSSPPMEIPPSSESAPSRDSTPTSSASTPSTVVISPPGSSESPGSPESPGSSESPGSPSISTSTSCTPTSLPPSMPDTTTTATGTPTDPQSPTDMTPADSSPPVTSVPSEPAPAPSC